MLEKSATCRYNLVKLTVRKFYKQSIDGRPYYGTGTAKLKEIAHFAVYGLVIISIYGSVVK